MIFDMTKRKSGGGGGTTGLAHASGSFVVASDYSYTSDANSTYNGSILVSTGLSNIKMLVVWCDEWQDQTATRPCFGMFSFIDSALCGVPQTQSGTKYPFCYGAGGMMNATASSWFGASQSGGPILNTMTASVAAGSFGIKVHSATYPIKAGSTIKWEAWGDR